MIPGMFVYLKRASTYDATERPYPANGMKVIGVADVESTEQSDQCTWCCDTKLLIFDYHVRSVLIAQLDISQHPCITKLVPNVDMHVSGATCVRGFPCRESYSRHIITFAFIWYPAAERALRRWVARYRKKKHAINTIERYVHPWLYRPGGRIFNQLKDRFYGVP